MPPRKKAKPAKNVSPIPLKRADQYGWEHPAFDPTVRALRAEIIDLRQAFLDLLKRHDGRTLEVLANTRHATHELERRLNIMNEDVKALRNGMPTIMDMASRLGDLEHDIHLDRERLDKLDGGGLDPDEQADNSRPVVKGGWINVYSLDIDGTPNLANCEGPFLERQTADNVERLNGPMRRIACLYLVGGDEQDD